MISSAKPGLLQCVFPGCAFDNSADGFMADAKLFRKSDCSIKSAAWHISFADFCYLLGCQKGIAVIFTLYGATNATTSIYHVAGIIRFCANLKVFGIYARWIVALMAHYKAINIFNSKAVSLNVGDTVRVSCFPLPLALAVSISRAAFCPFNAVFHISTLRESQIEKCGSAFRVTRAFGS